MAAASAARRGYYCRVGAHIFPQPSIATPLPSKLFNSICAGVATASPARPSHSRVQFILLSLLLASSPQAIQFVQPTGDPLRWRSVPTKQRPRTRCLRVKTRPRDRHALEEPLSISAHPSPPHLLVPFRRLTTVAYVRRPAVSSVLTRVCRVYDPSGPSARETVLV